MRISDWSSDVCSSDLEGIIGATLQSVFNDPKLSLKASPVLTWVTLFVYGIWTNAPFSFVVFYAGLQTVPGDTLESAMIAGRSEERRGGKECVRTYRSRWSP